MAALNGQIAELSAQLNGDKLTKLVDDAIAANKLVPAQREPLPLVEQFGRLAEHERVEVSNGTDCPDFRDVYYFLDNEDVYNSGYRSGGTWVDGWWS